MPRLTERAVARAKPRASKYEIACSVLAGFILRVLPSGKKAYYIRFRDHAGKDRRVRLGATTELNFAEALQQAMDQLNRPDLPPAPLARKAPRKGSGASRTSSGAPRAQGPTPTQAPAPAKARRARASKSPLLKDFALRYLKEYVYTRLKPSTQVKYKYGIEKRIIPEFGAMRIDELQFSDVSAFHASMRSTPYFANHNLVVLCSMYSRAVEWGVFDRNLSPPTRGVKKFPAKSRERFLTPKERAALDRFLDDALEGKQNRRGGLRWHSVATIRLLAFTGMRVSEVLGLTWDMVDERHHCFRLPDSKTGKKVVPVSEATLDLVRECRRVWEDSELDPKPHHVLYSRYGGPICPTVISKTWCERVRTKLPGMESFRLHDLRHSAASDALMAGVPLAVVGKILGHRKPETTARYAHIADEVLSDAVETMSRAISHNTRTGERQGRAQTGRPPRVRVRLPFRSSGHQAIE